MEKNIDVSVIIVNYNTRDLTKKSIDSVFEFTKKQSFEVFVVDNGSTDGSKELFSQDSRINYIFSDENLGFGRANNLAIEKANGKYVFLLNSDAYLIEDVISAFFDFMEKAENQNVACCGANVIDAEGNNMCIGGNHPTVKEAFARLGFAVFFIPYFKRYLSSGIKHYSDRGSIYEIDVVTGADMFIRKSTLNKTKAFDPDFFLYAEDTEMCFRFNRFGFKNFILADHNVVHLEGSSSKTQKLKVKKERLFSECRYLYFEKCHGKTSARLITILYGVQSFLMGVVRFRRDDFIKAKIVFGTFK